VGVLDKRSADCGVFSTTTGDVEPGRCFHHERPYYGGVHASHDNILICRGSSTDGSWPAGHIAHWMSVGGWAGPSHSMEATRYFRKAAPAGVKLISRGGSYTSVIDIMTVNSGLAEVSQGDRLAASPPPASVPAASQTSFAIMADTFATALEMFLDHCDKWCSRGCVTAQGTLHHRGGAR